MARTPPLIRRFVAYYRVSSSRHGEVASEIEEHRAAVRHHQDARHTDFICEEIGEFIEVLDACKSGWLQFERALTLCRARNAELWVPRINPGGRDADLARKIAEFGITLIAKEHDTRPEGWANV